MRRQIDAADRLYVILTLKYNLIIWNAIEAPAAFFRPTAVSATPARAGHKLEVVCQFQPPATSTIHRQGIVQANFPGGSGCGGSSP